MRFSHVASILLVVLQALHVIAGNVRVVENFLSLEESSDLLQQVKDKYMQTCSYSALPARVRSTVQLNTGIHTRLVETILSTSEGSSCLAADHDHVRDDEGLPKYLKETDTKEVRATSITTTSFRHSDHVVDRTAKVANPKEFKNAFVFLDDHPAAYFQYENATAIKVKKGALVIFDNHGLHQTIVPPPSANNSVGAPQNNPVHLLGPFTVTSSLGLTPALLICTLQGVLSTTSLQAGDYINVDTLNTGGCALIRITASKKNNRKKCRWWQPCRKKKGPYLGPSGSSPRLLNSSNPKYDPDLGSPNQGCDGGGPGVGAAGAKDQPYSNCNPLGNILIIQQNKNEDPNSWAYGGTITFTVAPSAGSATVAAVLILGLDSGAQATLVFRRTQGYADHTIVQNGGGKNSLMIINVDPLEHVTELSITATSSFAIADIGYY